MRLRWSKRPSEISTKSEVQRTKEVASPKSEVCPLPFGFLAWLGMTKWMWLAVAVVAGSSWAQVRIWTSRYGRGQTDNSYAVSMTPDGSLVSTGFSVGPDLTPDISTVKISGLTGDTLWSRRYQAGLSTPDSGLALAVDDSGNIFVAGKTYAIATSTDIVVVKYLADGTQDWDYRYHYYVRDFPVDVVPDRTGGAFVFSRSHSPVGYDYLVTHLRDDGAVAWINRLNGPGSGEDYATDLELDADGNLYGTGFMWNGSSRRYDYVTVRYDTTDGDTVWTRAYDGTSPIADKDDQAYALAVDDSGFVYVAGRAGESGTQYDATTVKYGPDGSLAWTCRVDAGEYGWDGAYQVAVDAEHNVYCGGFTVTGVGGLDFLVFRVNADGQKAWHQVYNYLSNDDDSLSALAIDEDGNVYITGSIISTSDDWDWLTIKYSTSGEKVWETQYGSAEYEDYPYDLVLDALGNIYVTGFEEYTATYEDYATVKYSEYDVGAGTIVEPVDSVRYGAFVRPKAWVRNYSGIELSFSVRLEIGAFYFDAQTASSVPPYDSALIEFSPWEVRDVGDFQVRCYTLLPDDDDPANDTSFGAVTALYVWEHLAPMPVGPKNKEVKDGGALAFVPDSLVFGFKGNNTCEFYAYNTRSGTWFVCDTIPRYGSSGRKKGVKKGARLEADSSGHVFALKGNSTFEFWRYTVEGDTGWTEKRSYPQGVGNRKVKNGSGLAFVPARNVIYSTKGGNTNEFYLYDVDADSWTAKSQVPFGTKNKRCRDGTGLAYDGDNTIYLLKGGTYEFYSYSISADSWTRKDDIRNSILSSRKRKVKKGGDLAWYPLAERVFASKGGKATEFWFFDVGADSWVETMDTIPVAVSGKPPDRGACLEYGNGKIFSLKGNRTFEFLRYHADFPLSGMDYGSGPMTARIGVTTRLRLSAVPNPFSNRTVLRYSLFSDSRVRLAVYDVTGRCLALLADEWQGPGEYRYRFDTDPAVGPLAAGVYFAKLEVIGAVSTDATSRKLLIVR